ncbi:hypothetical protein [Flavilitoribacter nigricans]|uniref:Uncharacterized protein n=1 Tax=Flavilitoribacter nigricans (strain ATCC 23147 / DSM 23189 / NBRC 102662 / NCIMB 1420 / SS-2) TaxID=1122177 RepID=A0A2D0NH95_FLAN2|nr:hypothetical protein [Flavilitoribacter nigricans]PHN07760.1 hypothetical protein CRP01_04770 [Flavilitoribacter nigricans DSM 23189 = NBRC 102662]
MHDLDRTTYEANGYDYEDEFDYEFEDEFDDEFEFEDEFEDEYDDEFGYEMSDSPFSEEEEAELAMEFLSVTNEAEMDEFLKSLWRKAKRGVRKYSGKAWSYAKKGLKKVAKKALPIAGRAVGTYFGGPLGGKVGSKLGSWASNLFEMELEGLSAEDQEFEIARRFVRFGGNAARNSMKLSTKMPAAKAVQVGFKAAARKHAPGLLKGAGSRAGRGRSKGKSGRWMRRGNRIVLFGA